MKKDQKGIASTANNYIQIIFIILFVSCITPVMTGCSAREAAPAAPYEAKDYLASSELIDFDRSTLSCIPDNPQSYLSVPTYITKVKEFYFIVDCYHNQVIYHDNLTDPIYQWQIMTTDINMGHSLASDGLVYLIDDTENNRVLIMEREVNENNAPIFVPTQEFLNIGDRPHYIIYDAFSDTFYVWSSESGEMFLFRHEPGNSRMYLTEVRSIPELSGIYVRSFSIIDHKIYFVSGNQNIIEADLDTFEIKNRYPVPDTMTGMIQLTRIQDYYYITISTDITGNQDYATMIRTKNLGNLMQGEYEDVYQNFIGGGTPYCITEIDGTYYLTEHRLPDHSIWSFKVSDNVITDVTPIY